MPIENDFTRVFGAIKELEERVERMERRPNVYVSKAIQTGQAMVPISTLDLYPERMSARDAMIDDNYADALYAQNDQLRFILSILAAVTESKDS